MADFPQVDFSPIGDLANVYRQSRQNATRQQVLSQLGQGSGPLDYETAAKALLASGDTQGGLSLANLAQAAARDTRDFGFRQQEATRAQTNTDRSFGLQERAANEAARGYDYREIDDGNGGKTFIRTDKATGVSDRVPIGGAPTSPSNPFSQGKMNEAQSKDALYTNRMLGAEKVLRSLDADVGTTVMGRIQDRVSNATGFNVRSPDLQKFDQAQRDFINATLRRESGAAIAQSEFDNANKQYFPQPGDTSDVIAQKRANRMEAIKGIGAGAGPGYKPASTFDEKGDLVPNPGAQATPKPPANPTAWRTKENITAARSNPQETINQARAAIAAGMPPQEAAQRLAQVGIDPKMLTAQPGFASPGQRQ